MIGSTLSHFEVHDKIGEGGMGEVYRAVDTRLQRNVALKLLSEPLASNDAESLARFEREAKALASVSHPNVGAIYEVGRTDEGLPFLVMELIEGECLRERLQSGPLPVDQALEIAVALTEGLEAAHRRGIVHRDLKPANIKAPEDGAVKILDFGIARLREEGPPIRWEDGQTLSLDLGVMETQTGMVVGTAPYMSPEQTRGKEVDSRTDVWAWACVLWEMLTGQPPFLGETVHAIFDAILRKEPNWERLPKNLPSGVVSLLRRCLEKDRRFRMRDLGDVRLALLDAVNNPDTGPHQAPEAAESQGAPASRAKLALLFAGLMLGAATASLVAFSWWPDHDAANRAARSMRLLVLPPIGVNHVESPALSPDGRYLAYLGEGEGAQLYLRELQSFASRPVPGGEGARNPFFSADSRWLFFLSRGSLRKVSVEGGTPVELCEVATDTPGGSWGPNNTVLYSPGFLTPLYQVSADGGTPKPFTRLNIPAGEVGHLWPELLPKEQSILFTIWPAGAGLNDAQVGLADVATGEHRALFPGSFAKYLSSGHLVYYHAGFFHRVGFDPNTGERLGQPRRVEEPIATLHPEGSTFKPLSFARDGTLAYIPQTDERVSVSWFTKSGSAEPWPFDPLPLSDLDLSPDGRLLVASSYERGERELALLDPAAGTMTRLELEGHSTNPRWHPDSHQLAFTSLRKGTFDLFRKSLDAGRNEKAVLTDPRDTSARDFTSDGTRLLFLAHDYDAGQSTFVVSDSDTGANQKVVVATGGDLGQASFSPDGKWLAYGASEEGAWEIYVQPFERPGARIKVSSDGGTQPLWSQSGELFYRQGQEIVEVQYRESSQGRFELLRRDVLFEVPEQAVHRGWTWDLAPDGRFMIAQTPEVDRPTIRVVTGFAPKAEPRTPTPKSAQL